MTEAEWMTCTDPQAMLKFLESKASDRKLRLFACACVRRFWSALADNRSRKAVEVSERFADEEASEEELLTASDAAWVSNQLAAGGPARGRQARYGAAAATLRLPNPNNPNPTWKQGVAVCAGMLVFRKKTEPLLQCYIIRDIVGNPFRPLSTNPAWLTSTVVSLARAIYEERKLPAGTFDHDRLAVLADALEDSGCDDDQVLSHLRGPGPHVRGCWVVDALLTKE